MPRVFLKLANPVNNMSLGRFDLAFRRIRVTKLMLFNDDPANEHFQISISKYDQHINITESTNRTDIKMRSYFWSTPVHDCGYLSFLNITDDKNHVDYVSDKTHHDVDLDVKLFMNNQLWTPTKSVYLELEFLE